MNYTAQIKSDGNLLKRPSPSPKGRSPLKKQSQRREKQLGEYRKLRADFLGANRECQVNWRGCLGIASEVHHRASRIGEKLNDVADFVATCAPCHRAIHRRPSLARKRNLLK